MQPIAAALTLALCAAMCGAGAAQAETTVDVVSSPALYVTSPGVLVEVHGTDIHPEGWASNDTLVTPFYQAADGDWFGLIGQMDYLIPGPNLITVVPDVKNPTQSVTLTIFVHDPASPLYPGPRPAPAPCLNASVGLAAPSDPATCDVQRQVAYVYRTIAGAWARYPLTGPRPADIASTTTNAGKSVPLIARVEAGVINRAPYVFAFLSDPAAEPLPTAAAPAAQWNGTLVYGAGDAFGIGVQGATHVGFFDTGRPATTPGSCTAALIAAGYAIATADTVTGPEASDIVAAETLLRVREQFIKRYGLPQATVAIGSGEAGVAFARFGKQYPGLDTIGPGSDAALAAAAKGCG